MAGFDIAGAKQAGYSDTEIANFVGQQKVFDTEGARKAGYSDPEIVNFVSKQQSAKAAPSAVEKLNSLDAQRSKEWNETKTGFGRGLAKVAGGIGQRLGIYSQQDVDAALSAMDTEKQGEGMAGKVGEFAGETAPFMLIPGGQARGAANIATNVATGMLSGAATPTKTGESATKNIVTGGITGGALSGGSQLLKAGEKKAAPALYESALKVPPSVPNDIRKKAVDTGLDNGITVSEKGLQKNISMIDGLNNDIKNVIDTASSSGATVDMNNVVTRIDSLKSFYEKLPKNTREEFLSELDKIQQKVAEDGVITASDAQKMKQAIYALHRKHYGELKSLSVEADKAIARGLKEELVAQYPELKNLNAKDSALINLNEVLERAVNRTRNYDVVRMGDSIIATMGAVLGGAGGAATAGIARHYFETAPVKSALAIALKRASIKSANINPAVTAGVTNAITQ